MRTHLLLVGEHNCLPATTRLWRVSELCNTLITDTTLDPDKMPEIS